MNIQYEDRLPRPLFPAYSILKISDLFSTLATPTGDCPPELPAMNTTSYLFNTYQALIGTRTLQNRQIKAIFVVMKLTVGNRNRQDPCHTMRTFVRVVQYEGAAAHRKAINKTEQVRKVFLEDKMSKLMLLFCYIFYSFSSRNYYF